LFVIIIIVSQKLITYKLSGTLNTLILKCTGLFDKVVENVYKPVSDHSILIYFAHYTVQYVYIGKCKLHLNMLTGKKVDYIYMYLINIW